MASMSGQSQDPGPTVVSSPTAQLYASLPIPRDSQSIRVLDILANSSYADNRLTGSLRIVDLKDSPRFTALSYVWGESSGKSITCNGYNVRITDSCFEALHSLRNSLDNFTIWVDAICINQEDDDEKAAQIPLMEQIYTWAEAAYIWLGPGTETTKKGLKCIRVGSRYRLLFMGIPWRSGNRVITMFQEHISLCKRSLIALYSEYVKERGLLLIVTYGLIRILFATFNLILTRGSYLILLPISGFFFFYLGSPRSVITFRKLATDIYLAVLAVKKLYTLFRRFCDRPPTLQWASLWGIMNQRWLQRSWTFQEIALASNPILVFGQDHISWLELHQGLTWAHDLGRKHRCYDDTSPDYIVLQTIQKWLSLCNVWQTIPRPCRWNGHRFRVALDESGNFRDDCSIQEYLQTPKANLFHNLIEEYKNLFTFLLPLPLYIAPLYMSPPDMAPLYMVYRERRETGNDSEMLLYELPFHYLYCLLPLAITFFVILRQPWQRLRIMGRPKDFDQRSHLVGIVQALRDRECSLKNDRVFAVKAILQRLGVCQPTADYSRSTGEIYHESFTGLVEWEPSFISLLIDTGSRLPGAPSWVPDWSTVAERSWLPSSYIYDSVQVPQWPRDELSISISKSILSVQAAFLLSVLCGHSIDRSEIDPDTQQVFNKAYTVMKRHNAQLEKELATMTGIATATRATYHGMAADKPSLAFVIDKCNQLAAKRGLFLCADGSIGSGAETMLEGDSIVFIKGVGVPMVLRRQSDGAQRDVYTVVGPSFIEGLMGLDVKELEKNLDWKQIDLA